MLRPPSSREIAQPARLMCKQVLGAVAFSQQKKRE
jgi:hypothetical protein